MARTKVDKLKVVILTRGDASRLVEILSELENVEIAGVILESAPERKRTFREKLERSMRYDGVFSTFKKLVLKALNAETPAAVESNLLIEQQNSLEAIAKKIGVELHKVDDYHTDETVQLIKQLSPDLGVLYGTNIIKESVFSIPRLGSINLHQGLAPLYRGGPTVFWELFNGESEIGITIHFVAPKVDTGDIILQRTLPLVYDFSEYELDFERFLGDFRRTLKEPSVEMIGEAIGLVAQGKHQRKAQDMRIGKRYRIPTKKEKDALTRSLKQRMKQHENKRYAF